MNRLHAGDKAPDFTLPDHTGRLVTLSEILRHQHTLLVFNLGFV